MIAKIIAQNLHRDDNCSFDDIVWVVAALSAQDKEVKRRLFLWAADCLSQIADTISEPLVREMFDLSITAQRKVVRGDRSAEDAWGKIVNDAWGVWAARTDGAAGAAWATNPVGVAALIGAAWRSWFVRNINTVGVAGMAKVARDVGSDEEWQFDRLIAWLSDEEPEDWPLPSAPKAKA